MKNWIKSHKFITGIIVFILLVGIVSSGSNKDENKSASKTAPTSTSATEQKTTETKAAQPSVNVPSYDLVDGKSVKVAIISSSDATTEKLTLIGKDLNKRFGSDFIQRIGVFTDKTQAMIMASNPLDAANLEGAAANAYDKAYVAQFNVNKSTGLKTYVIMLHGSQTEVKLD